MSIDVSYQGLVIARGTGLRQEGRGVYVEIATPMPVGTRLLLSHEQRFMAGRVSRVNEGIGPGMLVVPADLDELPRWITEIKPRDVQTVEIEADSELDLAAAAPAAATAPVAAAEAPAPAAPLEQAAAAPPAPAEQAATPAGPAAPVTSPPYEPTLEMAIPDLDDEPRGDKEEEAPRDGADKRPAKKKKPGQRRR